MFLPISLLICDHGEMVTTAFSDLDIPLYEVSSHLIPTNQQKSFIPVINAIQAV